jgi:hypothetical protein
VTKIKNIPYTSLVDHLKIDKDFSNGNSGHWAIYRLLWVLNRLDLNIVGEG